MTWEEKEKEYKSRFKKSVETECLRLMFAKNLHEPDDEDFTFFTFQATKSKLGLIGNGENLSNHARRIYASLQRAMDNEELMAKLTDQLCNLLDLERLIRDAFGTKPPAESSVIQGHFEKVRSTSEKIEGLLTELKLPAEILFALRLSLDGGREELTNRMFALGVPIDLTKLDGGIVLINESDKEATHSGTPISLYSEAELKEYQTESFEEIKYKQQNNPDEYNQRYNFIRVPVHMSMQEIKRMLTEENLSSFNYANKVDTQRAPKIMSDFAPKMFVKLHLNYGVKPRDVCALLKRKYGISKVYSDLDTYTRSLGR